MTIVSRIRPDARQQNGTARPGGPEADPLPPPPARAIATIQAAELWFDGRPVAIPDETVQSLLEWGSPAKGGFMFVSKDDQVKDAGLHTICAPRVGSMGVLGDHHVLAARTGGGIFIGGLARRHLVVFVPFDEDGIGGSGLGNARIVPAAEAGNGMAYYSGVPGHFLVSKRRWKELKK